ncbi:MAG TPA: hypothetical protein VEI81_00395 [Methanoregula sp.]|nr:hypothetical protein [Methanoregula sp.]
MANPYLSRNESMMLTSHRILFRSVMNDVVLTNQRIIIVDTNNPRFRPETIPLTTIETVLGQESGAGYPEITLSVTAPSGGGATIPVTLVFTQHPGESRVQERDEWVAGLRDQVALVRERVMEAGGIPEFPSSGIQEETRDPGQPADAGAHDGSMQGGRERAGDGESVPPLFPSGIPPGGPYKRPSLGDRFHPQAQTATGRRRSTVFVIVSVILFIAVIAAGGYFAATNLMKHSVSGENPAQVTTPPVTTPVPVPTTTAPVPATLSPETVPSLQPQTSEPPVTPVAVVPAIPDTGVWVHVDYAGNFTGSVGTSGRMETVSGTGSGLYRIPAQNDIVEAAIQKSDGSGKALIVEIYDNGTVAGHDTTSAPGGTIDLHVSVKNS